MSQPYAPATKALGICDRCGWTYKLKELKDEVVDLNSTGLLVCPTCFDPDQPQLQVGRWPVNDPQALRNARPDTGAEASRWGQGGSYGSNVWNFRSGTGDWRSSNDSATAFNTTTWNEKANRSGGKEFQDRTIAVTQTQSGYLTIDFFKTVAEVGAYTSIDSSTFEVLRMDIRLVGTADDIGSWSGDSGKLFWTTVTTDNDDPFGASDYATHSEEPNWNWSMGDQLVTMKWDLKGDANWTGTITGFRIYLYNNTDSDNYKTYEIDSIRVEES